MTVTSLKSVQGPWLHVWKAYDPTGLNSQGLNCAGTLILKIRGLNSQTREALFEEFAAVFQLPNYFGRNFDALDECIKDLEWLPADHYLLIFTDSDQLLSRESDLEVLCQILSGAANYWNLKRHKSFHILFLEDRQERVTKVLMKEDMQYESRTF